MTVPTLQSSDDRSREGWRGQDDTTTTARESPPHGDGDRWGTWDRFVESASDSGFMQASWWADFRATARYAYFGLAFRNHGEIVGGAQVLTFPYAEGRCFYYIPDGPVIPDRDETGSQVFAALLDAVEARRASESVVVSHLRIEPRWSSLPDYVRGFRALARPDRYTEPRTTLWVDLRPSEEAILAQMKPKGRYNIRVAQRHGVSVVEDTSERGLADFLNLYRLTARRKGLGSKPVRYFRALLALLAPRQRMSLFFAEYRGMRVAAAIAVHFEVMRAAKARCCDWYDFWGVAPLGQPQHPLEGISVFKRKFGGVHVDLVPTLDRVYDEAAYAHYTAVTSGNSGGPPRTRRR
jgi:peptidoglycan pentaglycine glycine transferase (the first glycine)